MELVCTSSWVLVLVVLVLGLYLLGTWPYDYCKKHNLPFVKPKPFVGNFGSIVFRTNSFGDIFVDLYNKFKGHSVAGIYQFLTPVIMVRDPEIIRLITVKDFDYFTDHLNPIREDVDPLFGRNLFTLQGQRWKDMRSTLSPAFTSSKMKAMFLLVRQIGDQLSDYLEKRCADEKDGLLTVDTKNLFTRYANDVIATAAFGIHCDSLNDPDNEFYKVGRDMTNFGGIYMGLKMFGFSTSPELMKMLKITFISTEHGNFLRSLVHGTIDTREREHIVRPDMIHLLMQAKKGTLKHDTSDDPPNITGDEKDRKKTELSDDDMTANVMLFLLAGFDTASTLLCFMSHLLAVHPDVQRRVRQEMDDILEGDNGELTYEGMQKMKYLDMVINETLRIYPPTVVGDRLCVKPYVLAATSTTPALHMKKGDGISFPVIGIHRDPQYFPDPMKFDPERFSDENKHNIKPFTFIPFGVGPRNCIGMRFALMEAKIAFTCLLTRFDLEVVAKTPIPIVLSRKTFNMIPEGGFWLGLRPRGKRAL